MNRAGRRRAVTDPDVGNWLACVGIHGLPAVPNIRSIFRCGECPNRVTACIPHIQMRRTRRQNTDQDRIVAVDVDVQLLLLADDDPGCFAGREACPARGHGTAVQRQGVDGHGPSYTIAVKDAGR